MSGGVNQVVVVSQAEPRNGQGLERTAFFDEDGNPIEFGGGGGEAVTWATLSGKPATFPPAVGTTATTAKAGNYVPTSAEVATGLRTKTQVAALTAVATPDATDEASAITLVNALKASVNGIIAALKA